MARLSVSSRSNLWFILLASPATMAASGECGLYFAKSTIPGAGLGMFAGVNFTDGSFLSDFGDPAIPLVDISIHQDRAYNFLWDEYTWDGSGLLMDNEAVSPSTSVASMGFGAAVNCILDLVNVKEGVPANSNEGLHRSKDPGAGAFSTYWNRQTVAKMEIIEGEELFASYGESYFTSRAQTMGPVPLKGDLHKSDILIKRFQIFLGKNNKTIPHVLKDMWESFVWNNPFNDTSRVLFSIPKNWEETDEAFRLRGLRRLRRKQHSRSLQWIKENGVCGDYLTVGPSTLPQAGRGAFAKRNFLEGSVVLPLPLIHLADRTTLDMYNIINDTKTKDYKADTKNRTGSQLLLNYCMGHKESTLLLCPYGTFSGYINHNQSLANVKLQWADPEKSNHHQDWLNLSVSDLDEFYSSGLAMELVATRDIDVNDEILLDYGHEWEEAWRKHVTEWPYGDGEDYISSFHLNTHDVIKTEFEQVQDPYPENIEIRMNLAFDRPRSEWLPHWRAGTLEQFIVKADEYTVAVEVVNREQDKRGNNWYDTLLRKRANETQKFKKLPREAIKFFDRPRTSDMHLPYAFRHDIRVPDEIFPKAWKNAAPARHEPKEDTCAASDTCEPSS